jgi:hypothetical protein
MAARAECPEMLEQPVASLAVTIRVRRLCFDEIEVTGIDRVCHCYAYSTILGSAVNRMETVAGIRARSGQSDLRMTRDRAVGDGEAGLDALVVGTWCTEAAKAGGNAEAKSRYDSCKGGKDRRVDTKSEHALSNLG